MNNMPVVFDKLGECSQGDRAEARIAGVQTEIPGFRAAEDKSQLNLQCVIHSTSRPTTRIAHARAGSKNLDLLSVFATGILMKALCHMDSGRPEFVPPDPCHFMEGVNVYLFCTSENLATVVLGWVDREALATRMELGENQRILLSHVVGYPAD